MKVRKNLYEAADKADHVSNLRRKSKPGEWVHGCEWTIYDSDRDAQKRGEPYWTLVRDPGSSNIAIGPIGRKSRETESVINVLGQGIETIEMSEIDGELIVSAVNGAIETALALRECLKTVEKAERAIKLMMEVSGTSTLQHKIGRDYFTESEGK